MPRILVSGALANKPGNGGNAWSRLSWIRGFQRVGHEVLFVEQLARGIDVAAARAFFRDGLSVVGLARSACLLDEQGAVLEGPPLPDFLRVARGAGLLFNISGHLTHPDLLAAIPCRVYYDDDPGFTQQWQQDAPGSVRLEAHTCFATLGANIGRAGCPIPTCGLAWIPTRPPVALEDWPLQPDAPSARFTTVASWRGAYGPIAIGGATHGVKAHEFRKVIALPRRVPRAAFEVALSIHDADARDREALAAHGWQLVDPAAAAGTCESFRTYVQRSGAECSVAQGVYAGTRSGWCSDRTVRYLASGRPALVQDTGLAGHLPLGEGLLTFNSLEEAAAGAESILADPRRHAAAARRLAEEYFAADRVVDALLREIGWP